MMEILNKLKRKLKMIINKKSVNTNIIKKREEHIKSIMQKTGWTREETIENVKMVRKRIGMTYADFDKYDFFKVPVEKELDRYLDILNSKKIKYKKARKERMHKKLVLTVVLNTGWQYEFAKKVMEKSKANSLAEYKDYVAYRFWEVDEETQKTYYTIGVGKQLKKKYNINRENVRIFINKDQFNEKFNKFLGRPWLSNINMTYENFENTFSCVSKIIYKPRAATRGSGVEVFDLDKEGKGLVYKKILSLPEGVIEGYIKQHAEMSKYSRQSVNTIRIVTVRTFNKINILYAVMRMGGGNAVVDNFHAGGVLAIVDINTGSLTTEAVDLEGNVFVNHPVTNEKIIGFKIPYWNEVIKLVQKAGLIVDGVGYVGWDVAITENGPVLIEGNTQPGAHALQTYYARFHKGMKPVVEKYL